MSDTLPRGPLAPVPAAARRRYPCRSNQMARPAGAFARMVTEDMLNRHVIEWVEQRASNRVLRALSGSRRFRLACSPSAESNTV